MEIKVRRIVTGAVTLFLFACALPAQQMPKTTKETIPGQADVKSEQLRGTVLFVEGNKLAVRMSDGEIRSFNPPASRRFLVDGKELTVQDLKPGTTLTATVTTTTTSLTDRTKTVGTGRVWFVSGNTVILTLPNNENRSYKVSESYRFMVDGQKASVHDLRKGMTIAAEKIVEEPRTEIASNTVVTGHAPLPPQPVKAVETAAAPEPQRTVPPRTVPERPAPEAAPAAPRPSAFAERAEPGLPAKLPKTASSFPLAGLAGLMLTAAALGLRMLRRA